MVIPWERIVIMKLEETKYNISGIYKITFDNNKIYIGRTNSLRRRMIEHIGKDVREYPELPISKAIKKHKIIDISMLEEIPAEDFEKQKEREQYWIAKYNSFLDKTIGYNNSIGGEGAGFGIYNQSASIKSQEILNKIIDLLLNTNLTYEEICEKTGVANRSIIRGINSGTHYYNNQLDYPLRKKDIKRTELENKQSKFYNNQQLLLDIIEALKNPMLSLEEISQIYDTSISIISLINTGKKYRLDGITYPIRYKNQSRLKLFSNEQLIEIKEMLLNRKYTMTDIGQKFNIDRKAISDINIGKRQRQNDWNYPIRDTTERK